jgi:hypothetical protein
MISMDVLPRLEPGGLGPGSRTQPEASRSGTPGLAIAVAARSLGRLMGSTPARLTTV